LPATTGIDVLRFADGTEWDRTQLKNVSLYRGDGHNNSIADSGADDVIHGGKGDDYIRISEGNDTILYGKGDGYDIVHDTSGRLSEHDIFVLTDLNPQDIELSRVGSHLLLTVKSTGEYVDFDDFFPSNAANWTTSGRNIEAIRFADGTTWNRAQIQQNAWYRGTDRIDSITGSDLDDTIVGGKGDDILEGWTGSDTFMWKTGDGNDQISDFSSRMGSPSNSVDTLWLQDVASDQVSYSYQGKTLLITINPTGEIIRVNDFFSGVISLLTGANAYEYGIDQIKFQDGSIVNRQQITYNAGRDYLGWNPVVVTNVVQGLIEWQTFWDEFGHEGNIVGGASPGINDIWNASIYGGPGGMLGTPDALQPHPFHGGGKNILNGAKGNDILAGGGDQDVLYGAGGNDILYGDYVDPSSDGGNDVIFGGDGNDALYGGGGSDVLNADDGNDYLSGGDGKDFLNGGAGNDVYVGGRGDDFLDGRAGSVTGSSGNDTYFYARGDGNDVIAEALDWPLADTDVLSLTDLSVGDVELSRTGNDLLVRVKSTGDIVTVIGQFAGTRGEAANVPSEGIEIIRFAEGIEWDRQTIQENAWYRGTDGRDVIATSVDILSDLDDTIEAGKGDDVIQSGYQGGSGNDTFVYSRGDGNDVIYEQTWRSTMGSFHDESDTLRFIDINASDVELTRSGSDLLVKVLSTNETITIVSQFVDDVSAPGNGLERILFANGETWGRDRIQQEAWFRGTDGNDLIDARISNWDDTIEGGKGDDIIYTGYQGYSGNDTFVYASGDGNDVIYEQTWRSSMGSFHDETDTLVFRDIDASDINLTRSGSDLFIKILPTNETITIVGQFGDNTDVPDSGIEYIRFANGDQWGRGTIFGIATSNAPFIVGTNGNNMLAGSSASQNIYGEGGDDRIDGQGGNDLLYGGQGNDTMILTVSAPGDIATINDSVGTDTLDLGGFAAAAWIDLVTNGAEVRTRDQSDLASGTWRKSSRSRTSPGRHSPTRLPVMPATTSLLVERVTM
jgi:Ca2+-binding RTX toxin-like protein